MKSFVFILVSFACFWSCSNSGTNSGVSINKGDSTTSIIKSQENSVNGNLVPQPVETPSSEGIRNPTALGSFKVDCYEDNELFSTSFFRNGLYIKGIGYNTRTKKKENETTYLYKKNGQFDHATINGVLASKDENIEIERSFGDFDFRYAFLKSKGIEFPLADIVADEVSDLSEVLSTADNYTDFKREDRIEANKKIYKFIGFNKTCRFHNSTMASLIGNGDFINIKDYELTLENGFPLKEIYRTNDGELTKTYSYKDGRLTGLVYKFTDLKNQSNSLEKRFEYHELNQKP